MIQDALPDHNRICLNAQLPVRGDLIEQTMGRQYLVRIPAVRKCVRPSIGCTTTQKRKRSKRGELTRNRRGNLRERLVARKKQSSMNDDVSSMSGSQLIDVLGSRFEGWMKAQIPMPGILCCPGGTKMADGGCNQNIVAVSARRMRGVR